MGVSFDLFQQLEDLLTVHGRGGQVNPAFAPAEVLAAMPDMDLESAKMFVEERQQYHPADQAALILPNGQMVNLQGGGGVISIRSRATLDNGAWTQLEATVSMGTDTRGRPFRIVRWREKHRGPMILNVANDYWGSVVARYRTSPLPGFLAWWRGELAGLLPASLRRRMVPPRPALWLVAEGDDTDIVVWRGGDKPEQLASFSAREDVQVLRKRWIDVLNRFDDGSPEIRLCLPSESVLQCPVELPLAVEANLDSALGYQLDQLTPFRAADVYFDHRITGRNTRSGRLELDLRLVPITRVSDLTERLAAIGIRPHAIDTIKDDREVPLCEDFNLLPEEKRPR